MKKLLAIALALVLALSSVSMAALADESLDMNLQFGSTLQMLVSSMLGIETEEDMKTLSDTFALVNGTVLSAAQSGDTVEVCLSFADGHSVATQLTYADDTLTVVSDLLPGYVIYQSNISSLLEMAGLPADTLQIGQQYGAMLEENMEGLTESIGGFIMYGEPEACDLTVADIHYTMKMPSTDTPRMMAALLLSLAQQITESEEIMSALSAGGMQQSIDEAIASLQAMVESDDPSLDEPYNLAYYFVMDETGEIDTDYNAMLWGSIDDETQSVSMLAWKSFDNCMTAANLIFGTAFEQPDDILAALEGSEIPMTVFSISAINEGDQFNAVLSLYDNDNEADTMTLMLNSMPEEDGSTLCGFTFGMMGMDVLTTTIESHPYADIVPIEIGERVFVSITDLTSDEEGQLVGAVISDLLGGILQCVPDEYSTLFDLAKMIPALTASEESVSSF